ncbi:DUF4386 family protein [Blastococcus sp. PRF04-17]|uniref:DUF4386 family protein n=1 Tax=Blastococcus sp. PRF04-17 TaxID=2933797 RepID=UPI001FF5612C|nr:DUF4386 family protein [Blastococcus sp. PRF04-17]UOY03663.1 DUF4386 family protein [Blastococcus sp. PRF04-17]
MSKILDRVADAGGILYFVLVAVGYVVLVSPFLPETLESPDAVRAHLVAHPPTASLWLGAWLEAAGLLALLLLAARLAARIRAARPLDWLPTAAVGVAVAAFAVKIGSFAPVLAALDVDRYDAGTVTALLGINDAAHGLAWALDGVFVLLLGLGALASRALPTWLGALTVAAGTACLAATAAPGVLDALQVVFLAWVLVVSGWLLVRGERAVAPERSRRGAESAALPLR